jgi:hypothetical protein
MSRVYHCKSNIKTVFKTYDDFNIDIIKKSINYTEYTITSTLELYKLIVSCLNATSKVILDIQKIWYDHDSIIFMIIPGHEQSNTLIFKRVLNPKDTYNFFKYNITGEEEYTYLDMDFDEVINALRLQFVNQGVYANLNGTLENVEYFINPSNEPIGTIFLKDSNGVRELNYINMEYVKHHIKDEEELDDGIRDLMKYERGLMFMVTEVDIGIAIVQKISPYNASIPNINVSKILNTQICGPCYIGLLNNDTEENRLIPLHFNKDIFLEMLNNIEKLSPYYKQKNDGICNFYRELKL